MNTFDIGASTDAEVLGELRRCVARVRRLPRDGGLHRRYWLRIGQCADRLGVHIMTGASGVSEIISFNIDEQHGS